MLERVKKIQRVQKIKTHFQEHKTVYITGVSCLVAGALFASRGGMSQTFTNSSVGGNVINKAKHVTVVTAELERRGHPGNVIRCNETGEIFASQQRAADLLGISPTSLSQHLHGKQSAVSGFTFENLGEAQ